jgi:hypothetical protein
LGSYGTKGAFTETHRSRINLASRNLCLAKFRSQKPQNPAVTTWQIKDAPDVRLGMTNDAIDASHRGKADT